MTSDPYSILRRARERGLLTEPQLNECLSAPPDRAIEWAVERGYISRDEAAGLALLGSFADSTVLDPAVSFWENCRERPFGRYVLKEKIGEGAQAFVVKAFDEQLGRAVALKILKNSGLDSSLQRFQREAQAMARLKHPHIVPVYDIGMEQGWMYFSIDLISGGPLSRVFEDPAVPLTTRLAILEKVARACHHAHAHGVVHRDLKPQNILVDASLEPFITDFGIARITIDQERFTHTGAVLGTAEYMSPEHIAGKPERVTAQSDIFSLGAMIYEAATGRLPFSGESMMDVFRSIERTDPPRPRSVRPDVPADVEAVILKALEKDPLRRYATAADLADDLARCVQGRPVRATRWSPLSTLLRRARRHAVGLVAGTVAACLVAGAAAFVVGERLEESRREERLRQLDPIRRQFEEASRLRGPTGPETAREIALTAVPTLEQFLKEDPRLTYGRILLSQAHEFAGHGDLALQEIDRAVHEAPDSIEALTARARLNLRRYCRRRDPTEPESAESAAIRRLIESDLARLPPSPSTFDRLVIEGALKTLSGAPDRGSDLLKQALAVHRLDTLIWHFLALAHFLQDRHEEAEREITEALNLSQAGSEHWLLRGAIRLELGKHSDAISDLNMSEKLAGPRADSSIFTLRGNAYQASGDYPAALRDHDRAIEMAPTSKHYSNRGNTRHFLSRLSEALEDFARAIELEPGFSLAYSNRASVYCTQGRFQEAIADCDRSIKLDAANFRAYINRGAALVQLKRPEEALTDLNRAIELRPGVAVPYYQRGLALELLNRAGDAVMEYDRAIELDSKFALALYRRAVLHGRAGRHAQALLDSTRVIELGSQDFLIFLIRALAHANLGMPEDALKDFARSIQMEPRRWESVHARGMFLFAMERDKEARADLAEALKRMPEDDPNQERTRRAIEQIDQRGWK